MQEPQPLHAEDLPLWMKPRPRQIDYALLAVFVLCLALALPLLTRAGLPSSPTTRGELARITTVEDSLQAGIVYPRWAQHFHFGFGSPLPNYLAPAGYYAGGLTMLLTQSDATASLRFLLVGEIFLAGFGMFFAARRLSGTLPAFVAALVYLLAPTTIYRLALTELNLPLMTAAALFPWALWSADRLLAAGDGRDLLFFAVMVGLLVMAANLMGPLLLLIVSLWLVWRGLTMRERRASWRGLFAGLVLGIGLAAIYWLPAVLEWRDIRWLPLVEATQSLSLRDVIRPTQAADFDALNVPSVTTPGLAALILGMVGIRWRRFSPYHPFAAMGVALLIVAALVPSAWLDDVAKFPALSRIDLLLPLTACCAMLSASAIEKLERLQRPVWLWLGSGIVAVVTVAAAYPILQAPPFSEMDGSRDAYLQAELSGTISGSFRDGQLLPDPTRALPDPSPSLIDSFSGEVISKIERTQQLPRANLAVLLHTPTRDRVRVNLPGTIELEILTLFYPGWRARYQGEAIRLERAENGLLRVDVPAGAGVLDIQFTSTSSRSIGSITTLASLLMLIAASMMWRATASAPTLMTTAEQQNNAVSMALSLLAIGLILMGRSASPQRDSLADMTPLEINFASDVSLLGIHLPGESVARGEALPLTVFLRAMRDDIPNYSLRAALVNTEDGQMLAETHRIAAAGWFSSEWPTDRYLRYDLMLTVPVDADATTARIEIQLTGCESTAHIAACEAPFALLSFDSRGRPLGDSVTIAPEISIR